MIVPLIKSKLNDEQEFIEKFFSIKWTERGNPSCLIVVNKVKRSIDLFKAVEAYKKEKKLENPLYYLSTNIVPCHRLKIIERIKEDLQHPKKYPILISTQVVEAGVDLDFDMGFRDLAPIDSIVQVAGRINRQTHPQHPDNDHLPLFVIDFGDCEQIYGAVTKIQSEKALIDKKDILESDYLYLVNDYFSEVSNKSSFDYSRKIFGAMKTLKYDGNKEDYPVSSFEIIKEQENVRSVFIEIDERATEVKEAFLSIINAKDKEQRRRQKQEFDVHYKKDFNQRIITVPFYYTSSLEKIHSKVDNILLVSNEMLNNYYNTDTGFKRDPKIVEPHTLML